MCGFGYSISPLTKQIKSNQLLFTFDGTVLENPNAKLEFEWTWVLELEGRMGMGLEGWREMLGGKGGGRVV